MSTPVGVEGGRGWSTGGELRGRCGHLWAFASLCVINRDWHLALCEATLKRYIALYSDVYVSGLYVTL